MTNIDDLIFVKNQISKITDSKIFEDPSKYIERSRYLNKELTPIPGYYKFDRTPFWKEPLDAMSPLSPYQKIVVVKGVQIGATTGILENAIAYNIGSDPKPVLYISADKELVKMGMQIKIERMLDSCNLRDKIFSQTGGKSRKTGDTTYQKEYPGGFLVAIGAQSPGKLRSMSFPIILFDELDGMPDQLGREGDPVSLAENRTNAYAEKRKILYISTPLVEQSSKIWPLYLRGDQRKFFVKCKHCGEMQDLEWHGVTEDGKTYGITFSITEDFEPDYDTVAYKCKYCGGLWKNHDKAIFMPNGEWRPTSTSKEPGLVSYHVSALYSGPGMFSWENVVAKWAKCWDLQRNRVKDKEKYREFRNLMEGKPFQERGQQIRFEKAKQNRSMHYLKNQINNTQFKKDSGSEILLLTCAVDVHKKNLYTDIKAWCKDGISYTIDTFKIEGDTEVLNGEVWQALDDIIMNQVWTDENGKNYRIINTVIDSGHYTKYVYEFAKKYSQGVMAIKGDDWITGGLTYKPFTKSTLEKAGLPIAYFINSTKMKDFIADIFNKNWDSGKIQPDWFANFPNDYGDDMFHHFEGEQRVDEYDKITNKWLRRRWRLIPGRENHGLDLFCYNLANLELIADSVCRNDLGLDYLDWTAFWDYAAEGYFYN
jgi:phage terminase large subunit GpA-like protein